MSEPTEVPALSSWEQFKLEFGWTAVVVGVLVGEVGLTGVITAVISGPSMDVEGWELFFRVFVTTAPLTVAGVAFFTMAFSDILNSVPKMIGAGLACLIVGMAVGGALGTAVGLDPDAVAELLARNGSSVPGMSNSIFTIMRAYYALYGEGFFLASLALGVFFGRWGAWLVENKNT